MNLKSNRYMFSLKRAFLLVVLALWVGMASAAFTIRADSVTGTTGSQAVVPIRGIDFIEMVSNQGTIEWNTAVATFDSAGAFGLPNLFPANFGTALAGSGKVTFSWDDPTLQGVTVADSTILFSLYFQVVGAPGTQTPITFVNTPTNLEFSDTSFSPIPFTALAGQIEVPPLTNCNDPTALAVANLTAYSADLQWNSSNPGATYTVEWGLAGFTPGSGIGLRGGNTVSGLNTESISGLAGKGNYEFYVTEDCGPVQSNTVGPIAFTTPAGNGFTILADSVSGFTGGNVAVPIRVKDFIEMISLQGTLEWDTSVVAFDSVEQFGLPNLFPTSFGTTFSAGGKLTYSWDDPSLQGVTLADSAIIFALRFDIIGSAGTQSPVSFVFKPTTQEYVDTSFAPINYTMCGGEVEIPPLGVCVDPDSLDAINIGSASADLTWFSANPGATYTVEWGPAGFLPGSGMGTQSGISVNGTNSISVIGLSPQVDYDFYVIEDCGGNQSANVGPEAFQTAPFSGFTIFMDSVITNTGASVAVPVRVKEFVEMVAIQGTIDWDTAIAVFDSVEQFGLPSLFNTNFGTNFAPGGQLTFSWDDPSLQGVTLPDSAIIFALRFTAVGAAGTQTPTDFIQSPTPLEFSDTSFVPIAYAELSGLIEITPLDSCPDPDSLVAVNITDTSASLTWQSQNNGSVYTVEYGPAGFTPGSGTTLTGLSLAGINSVNIIGLTPVTQYDFYVAEDCGDSTSNQVGPATFVTDLVSGFTIFADSVSGPSGGQAVCPVRVRDFIEMISIQGTVEWDTAVATFNTVQQFGLTGMSAASFGTTFTPGGQLTFSWDDASLQGVTVPDSTVIFAIRYDLVGPAGSQTPVDFTGLITQLEFTDTSLAPIGYTTLSGLVEITAPQDIVTDSLAGPYCPGQNVSIGFTAIGTFNTGNTFYAELSDATGSFANPDTIGMLMDSLSGTIAGVIPPGTPSGTGYRIRVVADDPIILGVDNGINLTIGDVLDSIAVSICTGDSVFAGGAFQTASGTYVDTLTTVAGCDSIVTTTLTVLTDLSDSVNVSICTGDSIFAGGAFQTASGTYSDTLTASGGCDSLVTTILVVLPNSANAESVNICAGDSLFAGGAFQTTSGVYVDTLVSANGCDSVLTTTLTVLGNSANTISPSICQGDSVFAGGAFQTTTGIYVDTLIAANGCDSILTTNLTVTLSQGATVSLSICQGDSVFAGGAFQTITGVYADTLTAASGCDSIVTTNLTVLSFLGSTQNISICLGDSLLVGGGFQTTSGIYTDTLNAAGGCDSIVTTNLSIEFSASTANATICEGDSFLVGGAFQTTAGVYTDTLTAASGCDSVITTTLIVRSNIGATLTTSICAGDSIFIAGAFRSTPGVYPDTLTGSSGCDSIVTTILILDQPAFTSQSVSICQGDSVFAGGAFQQSSGVFNDTLSASNGCDSIVTTNLTVISNQGALLDVTICQGDSFLVGGGFQTTSGIFTDTLTSAGGCDSIVTTNLNVQGNIGANQSLTICQGDSLFTGGAFQTVSGTYTDTLTSSSGCDSIVTTNLTVLSLGSSVNIEICEGDSVLLGGAFQTTNGIYTDTLVGQMGCDSVISTFLSVVPSNGGTIPASICFGDSMQIAGVFRFTAGSYPDTLTGSTGCDSIVTTLLSVEFPTFSNVAVTICQGDSFFVGGAFQFTSGIFADTLVGANGCDSIHTVSLTVPSNQGAVTSVSICQGDSLFAGGAFQTSTGIYTDTLTSSAGCDSIVSTNLTVISNSGSTNVASICLGDSLFAGGAFQTTTGIYRDTLVSGIGCDSVVVTQLSVLNPVLVAQNLTACEGDSVFAGGMFQTTSGIYFDTLTAGNGCDSIVQTILSIIPTDGGTFFADICTGDSLLVGGGFQTTTGIYIDTLSGSSGCDSIVTTVLTVLPVSNQTVNASLCSGDSLLVGGAFQTTSGTYLDTLVSANGCDSVVTTQLTVLPTFNQSVTVDICEGDSLFVGGAFQTVTGAYMDTLTSGNGCDSILTTNLTVIGSPRDTVVISICDGDSVFVGGAFQTTSGLYTDVFSTPFGCDSLLITDLTVLPNISTTLNQAICQGDTVVFGGADLTVGGVYMDTLTAGNGCDSVVTLNLTVNPLPPVPTITPAGSVSVCVGSSLTLTSSASSGNMWNPGGQSAQAITVTTSGSYEVTFTDGNGCASTSLPTVVTVNPLPTVDLGPDTVICNGASVTLDAGSGFSSYLWTGGPVTQTLSVNATGNYAVTVTDTNNCTATDDINVVVAPLPVVDLGPDTTVCAGSVYVLDAGAGFASYAWTPGGQITSSISVTASGTYGVTVTDVNGCTAADQVNVVFAGAVAVNLGPDQDICQGETVTLDAGAGFSTYSWTPGLQSTQTITVNTGGVFTVTVTDANGCTGTDQLVVQVNATPNVNIGNDTTICGGTTYTLDAGSGFAQYDWFPSGNQTQTIDVTTTGLYWVEVQDGNNCVGRDSINLTFGAGLPVNLGPDEQFLCDGEVLTLDAGSGFSSYVWSDGTGLQTLDVTNAGGYWVEVTDGNGCIGNDSVEVVVLAGPTAAFTAQPNGLTVTFTDQSTGGITAWNWTFGDGGGSSIQSPVYTYATGGTFEACLATEDTSGCRDTTCITIMLTGREDAYPAGSVTVFPNPTHGNLFVQFALNQTETVEVSLVNMLGQSILTLPEQRIGQGRVELDLSRVSQGMYFLRVEGENGVLRQKVEVLR